MKNMVLTGIMSISIILLIPTTSLAAKIGYGFSDAVLPAKNQELFYMGFEAGVNEVLKNQQNTISLVRVTDNSQMGAIKAANELLSQPDVVMLTGFPTSHEALLAAPISKQSQTLALFAGAGHSNLATYGQLINTTGESMELSVNTSLDYIAKHYSNKRGLVINNPKAVFSKNQEDVIKTQSKKKLKINALSFANLNSNQKLTEDVLNKLREGDYDYLILTPYADESVGVLEQLGKAKIDIPIITNSSWTTGDVEYIRRFLSHRKSEVISTILWSKKSPSWKLFENKIIKLYGRTPTSEMAYGYDVGIVAATIMKLSSSPITRSSIEKIFEKHRCFNGTSSGRLCFSKDGGHALRKIWLVKFTISGYEEINP